jgi:DNA-binding response OmpR family regulator
MRVLVIEDSARLNTSLGAGLRALGYAVDVVADSTRAIDFASRRDYDIIILDLMLPKDSSLLVPHEIRELNRDVEILILSARDQIHDRVTALIQGADDYLVKPFSFDELHARIQELVRRKANHKIPIVECQRSGKPQRYFDDLIGNLLHLCGNDNGDIELVISEVKLADLLQRVVSPLKSIAAEKEIVLRLPREKLPSLLLDAKWMEHLLSNLIFDATLHCPAEAEIRIRVQDERERCRIEIETPVDEAFDLSLVRSYASYLKLEIDSRIIADDRFCVGISNIKIV